MSQLSKKENRIRSTRDLLLLADLKVPLVDLREWSGWQFTQADEWAAAVHLHASDTNNRVPAKPGLLKKYSPPRRPR